MTSIEIAPVSTSKTPIALKQTNHVRDTIQRLFRTVIFVSLFLIVCKLTHFRTKMLYDPRINRKFLSMFYLSSAGFGICYTIMVVSLRILKPKGKKVPVDDWDKASPKLMASACVCLVAGVVSFIFALWPCFQFATFIIGTLGLISLIFTLQWIPI